MGDNNAPRGVRSLMAKFENSPIQVTSPPSRGRSPDTSDTPGSARQLSKVRASFVTVDGVVLSNPGSPLRKSSGRSDSPGIFGPKINELDVETRRQNVSSPTPAGLNDGKESVLDAQLELTSAPTANENGKQVLGASTDVPAPAKETSPASPPKIESPAVSAPTLTSGTPGAAGSTDKPAPKTVTKRPSTINATRSNPAQKSPSAATSTAAKQTATTTTKSARETAKERANTLASKPSRASLNPATKTASRTARGSTPSQESSKTSPPNSAKSRPRSPTRPVRLPPSMTAQTQSSSAKTGSSAPSNGRPTTTTSTLTRKPSSLKSAAAASQSRPTVGTASGLRKQSSRPSLPAQQAQDRPSSRTSDVGTTTKPVNEGFLARMMRPTASSASKTHERPDTKPSQKDVKPAQKPGAAPKAPRPSMGRAPERSAQPKPKTAALRPHTDKSQVFNKEPIPQRDNKEIKVPATEQESEKENMEESTPPIPEEPEVLASNDTAIEQPEVETAMQPLAEVSGDRSAKDIELEATSEQAEPTTAEFSPEVSTGAPVEPAKPTAGNEVSEASSQSVEKSDSVEAPVEASVEKTATPVESNKRNEIPDATSVPDTEEIEHTSATPTESTGGQEFETQPESPEDVYQTPADSTDYNDAIAASRAENALAEVPRLSQPSEGPFDKGTENISDVKKDVISDAQAKPEEESHATESKGVQQAPNATGQKVDEIDVVGLALN